MSVSILAMGLLYAVLRRYREIRPRQRIKTYAKHASSGANSLILCPRYSHKINKIHKLCELENPLTKAHS